MIRSIFSVFYLLHIIALPGAYAQSFDITYSLNNQQKTVTVSQQNKHYFTTNSNASRRLRLVTLDWPPYIGTELCDKGWVFNFTVALFHELGIDISIEFLPWARAVYLAELGKADILFPEYYIESTAPSDVVNNTFRQDHLMLSSSFSQGPIGLLTRKAFTPTYNGKLLSIKGAKIGVVRG